jgi:hypothetical protein
LSFADAFRGKEAPFDPKVVKLVTDWLKEHESERPNASQ